MFWRLATLAPCDRDYHPSTTTLRVGYGAGRRGACFRAAPRTKNFDTMYPASSYSRHVWPWLPSPLTGLTSEFGMRSGVTLSSRHRERWTEIFSGGVRNENGCDPGAKPPKLKI